MEQNQRYADARATKEISLGPCSCPGTPHVNGDAAVVRTEAGWAEMKSAWGAGQRFHDDGSPFYDEALGDASAIARFTRSWTLVDEIEKGRREIRPITVANVLALDEPTFAALKAHFDSLVEAKGRLPNGSGAPSVASPRGSASPRRTTPRA